MASLDQLAQEAHSAPPAEFWGATLLVTIVAGAMLWRAFVFLKRKRMIEDMPTALVRSASQGYIELEGRAQFMDGDSIQAPLSMRPSVWYRYKVEKRSDRSTGRSNENRWVTIESGTSDDLFYLDDATGRCAIDPDGAVVTPAHANVWYGTSRIPGRYHDDDGKWWARTLGSRGQPFRYTEKRIEPGEDLYVLGNFTTHGGGATTADKDGEVADLLREWKRDQAFLLRNFDTNGDGEIELDEWQDARERAGEEVDKKDLGGSPPPVDVLGQTHDRRRPFVIHAGTEAEIISRCQRYAAGLLVIGIPLLVVSLWTITMRISA